MQIKFLPWFPLLYEHVAHRKQDCHRAELYFQPISTCLPCSSCCTSLVYSDVSFKLVQNKGQKHRNLGCWKFCRSHQDTSRHSRTISTRHLYTICTWSLYKDLLQGLPQDIHTRNMNLRNPKSCTCQSRCTSNVWSNCCASARVQNPQETMRTHNPFEPIVLTRGTA